MSRFEEEMLEAPDGVKLHTYTILQGAEELQEDELAPKAPTVLMLHANAGNMGHRLPLARIFVRDLKMNVVMVSYRGYGKSEGSPTEKGIRQDARQCDPYFQRFLSVLMLRPHLFYRDGFGLPPLSPPPRKHHCCALWSKHRRCHCC